MAAKISKAQRIRALYAQGKTCNEIAEIVGCRPEYVRVCAQQRVAGANSNADNAYRTRVYGSMEAYNEAMRPKKRAASLEYYHQKRRDPEWMERMRTYWRDQSRRRRQQQRTGAPA